VKNLQAAFISSCKKSRIEDFLAGLSIDELGFLVRDWLLWARPDQLPPSHLNERDWTTWLLLGGRGAGKTRAGAEWVRNLALGRGNGAKQIALVAQTYADAREIMVEGVSGLMSVHRDDERPKFESSRRRLEWPNGAIAYLFSAEDPERLRGPQFSAAWCDELAKWRYAQETWDMLQFGLRLGPNPRQVITTTPRPLRLLKTIMSDPLTIISRTATKANASNLSAAFLNAIVSRYEGTRLGRQELEGEILEDRPDGLWRRAMLEGLRISRPPPMKRIVVAVDPPASSTIKSDACGIICVGIGEDNIAYVLDDGTVERKRPLQWAQAAIALYRRYGADRLVAEVNQGGDMVHTIIAQVDPTVAVTSVRATRGKWLRAEPIAALYEQRRVRHVGTFPDLEDQMCDFTPEGRAKGSSPDRLDALVWALTDLMLDREAGVPRIRELNS